MAGIQVYTSSPINPNAPKSKEATAEPTRTQDEPAYAEASTTAYGVNAAQTARPGAPAVPAPSSAAHAYTPPSPTRTTAIPSSTNPPPPQPGQVPQPFEERGRTIPAPPQPSASHQPFVAPIQTQAPQANYPPPMHATPQWSSPNYAYAQPPAGVTSTDLSHPPGYIQNHGASFDDRYIDSVNKTHTPSPTRAGRGILDGEPMLTNSDEETSPIWDTAVSWAKEAGRKLSVVEGEVWKKLNGEK